MSKCYIVMAAKRDGFAQHICGVYQNKTHAEQMCKNLQADTDSYDYRVHEELFLKEY